MADIWSRDQYKVAMRKNRTMPKCLIRSRSYYNLRQKTRQNVNSFKLGFPEKYWLYTHTHTKQMQLLHALITSDTGYANKL